MSDPVLEALNRAADEHTPEDLVNIIAFLRRGKANFDGGKKPEKEGADVDVVSLLKITPKASPGFKKRI